jgi:hypothetical protein
MGILGRVIGWLIAGFIVSSIVAAVASIVMKGRLVRVDDPDADEVHLVAAFESLTFSSRATAFRGGTIDTWYGGGVIDLRGAVLDPVGAHFTVRAVYGGGEIVVPEGWDVSSRVIGVGGIGDGRAEADRASDAPRLTIDGIVVFGGFGITSDVSEEPGRELARAAARAAGRRPAKDDPVAAG